MPGVPRATPLESVASPIQNGQSLFARPSRPPPDLLSIRIHRLTPSTPPPSTLTAAGQGEEDHQEEADAQVLDRLQPTRRRWHHGRGVLCTRATPSPFRPFYSQQPAAALRVWPLAAWRFWGERLALRRYGAYLCGAQAALVAALLVSGGPALKRRRRR